ncbi:MAG: COX15/CtaA family protein [Saprospiraceae bacterium]|nr:COX15/CtaA family protein [Saprospiraceae bacterium]MBK8853357.1 COX15/CtaA family protein [Saprospiraceae bacterium]
MKPNSSILIWLYIGLIMIFIQIIVGGITRLTESGLSITKWEVVSGTIPPLSNDAWEREFELYKKTPQYLEINEGMSLGDFKFIYFWEYIHRFWARIMGFVFIIPFVYFLFKKALSPRLLKNLSIVILLAILAATFGWIMVASGLIERPWVNAYKLSIHLMIALCVFGYLYWTYLTEKYSNFSGRNMDGGINNTFYIFSFLLVFQIFLGGMMSGMKIAVLYPTWPTMNGEWLPNVITNAGMWNHENFTHYDSNEFMPALVQFVHRCNAYILSVVVFVLVYKIRNNSEYFNHNFIVKRGISSLVFFIFIQMIIGIITVIYSIGSVPVFIGVAHQSGAILVLAATIYLFFGLKKNVN